jgi:hypothetical protein
VVETYKLLVSATVSQPEESSRFNRVVSMASILGSSGIGYLRCRGVSEHLGGRTTCVNAVPISQRLLLSSLSVVFWTP